MRLNAYLARAGVASRRGAEELIRAGRVCVNGDVAGLATFVEPSDLVEVPQRVVPVGRLDANTTGALLLTNDGPLSHRLMHPRYEVDKVYEAEVEGEPDDEALRLLAEGVDLDGGPTAPASARRLGPSRLELTLHEGRKHQVKRMCEAVGHPVIRLHRRGYAGLTLEGVPPGAWRELSPQEVEALRALTAR